MSYKRCCIPGCSGTAGSENVLHEFPNPAKDLDRFMTWIHSIGGDILKLTNKFIYKNRRVCRLHFEAKYHCRFNRLSNIAVPTINMPYLNASVPMEQMPSRQLQNLLENVPLVSSVLTTDHTSAITTEEPLRIIQNLPVNRPSSATKYKKILPEECKDTADLLFFFDNLFDSVNGSFAKKKRFAKPLLSPATPWSVHHRIWDEGKKILKSMKFIDKTGKKENVPTLTNWVWTLDGIAVLLKKLEIEHNITSVWMRHLNQDPLENFFGAIRSHGCRNINPTAEHFESAFTTLLINSLTSVHTPGGNCEHDLGEALITLIDEDCKADDDSNCTVLDDILSIELEPMEKKKCDPKILAPIQYISGYFIKKAIKIYRSCETCKKELVASQETEYIKYREYTDRRWLCSTTDSIVTVISNIQDVAIYILKTKLDINNLKLYIKTVIYILVDFTNISCPNHKDNLIKFLIDAVCRFFIFNYCKSINKILYGIKDVDDDNDKFQVLARKSFHKYHKTNKN